jgi:mRNA interferase MazF
MDNKEQSDIKLLLSEIAKLLEKIKSQITKPNKIEKIWLEHLVLGKKILEWSLKKYRIFFKGTPDVVKKGYIFFCELGFNIGSEQNHKRPVVVLQNDKGNSSSPTTIVAPITTHRGMTVLKEENGKYYIKYLDDQGNECYKKLDYYEIPIEIMPDYKKEITGYINLAQIRTISKKRLEKSHVAIVNERTFNKIKPALLQLFDM